MPPETQSPRIDPPIFITILIVFAGLLGVLKVYYLTNGEPLPRSNDTTPLQTELSDWKTYRNEGYGIEFSYPPNMELDDHSGEQYSYIQLKNRGDLNVISIRVLKNIPEKAALEEFDFKLENGVYKLKYSRYGKDPEERMVNGAKAIIGTSTISYFNYPGTEPLEINEKVYRVLIIKDDTYALIHELNTHYEEFNQILSTFKFIK